MSRWVWVFMGAATLVVALALAAPYLVGRGDFGGPKSSAHASLETIKGLIDRFRLNCGRYPTTHEGLSALLVAPESLKDHWRGPYAEAKDGRIVDPWGNPYLYRRHGDSYVVICLGADGRTGGTGYDADLIVTNEALPHGDGFFR